MGKREIEELDRRKRLARQMGGEKNVENQHRHGKMTVRERIGCFCDRGSFQERGELAGLASYDDTDKNQLTKFIPCPFVMGMGRLDGRRIAVHGDDFTVKGASVGRLYKAKGAYFLKMARSFRVPMVRFLEGAGGSIREILELGYTELPSSGDEATQNRVEILSEVPVVSIAFGPAAGIAAMYMVQSHFSVMVKEKAHVFVGGPPLVKSASGAELSKEELGGSSLHARFTGVVDNEAENEDDALDQARRFLSYLPSNVWELPERRFAQNDDPQRKEEALADIIPENIKKPYDIRALLEMVVDRGSFFEIGKYQGRSQVTGLARLNGYPVGLLANDCRFLAGSFNYDVAEKFQRFIDMCDTFHLPIVNLCDQPGFTIGPDSEQMGTIRKGVRASFAMVQATVPVTVVYLRKCFGVAGGAQKTGTRFCWRYAWPSARWGNIPAEGGVYAAHRKEIDAAEDPQAHLEEWLDRYKTVVSPFRTAEAFGIEDIIDPRETRPLLCDWVAAAYRLERHQLGVKRRGMRC